LERAEEAAPECPLYLTGNDEPATSSGVVTYPVNSEKSSLTPEGEIGSAKMNNEQKLL
jgi:hypothetical protein